MNRKVIDIPKILRGEKRVPPYFYPLVPVGWAYGAAMSVRAGLYASSVIGRKRLPCRVISVGNITAGGTGKTPMTAWLTRMLRETGHSPAVLTRGYGGSSEGRTLVVSDRSGLLTDAGKAGDEACLLASILEGVPVVMGADRFAAGVLAVERFSPDVVVLDDGFQHMRLVRDLDIVLLDAARPFGNGRVLPAGYLREPVSAIRRAGAAVLTRADIAGEEKTAETRRRIENISPGLPVFEAAHRPGRLVSVQDGQNTGIEHLAGRDVFAFCGLADPASFTLILKRLNANITGFIGFRDHHRYTDVDIERIMAEAAGSGASMTVTTEKDAVKLSRLVPAGFPLMSLGVDIEFVSGEEGFRDMVAGAVA